MRRGLVVALLATLGMIACGQGNGNPVVPTPTPISPPTGALAPWASFPAGQTPRPVVLVGTGSPNSGFGNSEDAEMAAKCHKFTTAITLSKVIPRTANASWSTGTRASYPSISAAAAFAAMKQLGPAPSQGACTPVQPQVVTAVKFGSYGLSTDRGNAQIDSWIFTMSRIDGEIAYPAIGPAALWNADVSVGSASSASTLSVDGRSLTYTFYGSPDSAGPCGADYKAVVAESSTAVAIALQETPHASPGQPVACPAVAQQRTVVATLAQPVGGRVVVDATGNLISVCPGAKPDCERS